ncbi:serine/arginine-rich splicing factor 2-like [Camellia sinensis]|uniref:serine/arginine-rich splicing factor 2-like n=1 Tax=Camellia sinensis TaxID=4442 RepID=UPI001036D92F|nr:serine/arginine-rich splicing factor 2-like [Camellia sinensis]
MEEGGWKPVIRKHGGARSMHQRSESGIYIVFVDNLLESMEPKGLYTLFNNFGVVQDVFIPHKRRKMTRSRFGFVRYNCSIAASMAVQKANGLWCDNRALKVKAVDFVRRKEAHKRPLYLPTQRQDMRGAGQVSWKIKGKEFYAHVVSGKRSIASANLTLKVYEVGNGWLYNSAIV